MPAHEACLSVGRMREIRTSGSMSGEEETGGWQASVSRRAHGLTMGYSRPLIEQLLRQVSAERLERATSIKFCGEPGRTAAIFRSGVVAVCGGIGHSVALDSNGRVWAWGRNAEGQLGDGSTTDSSVPVPVSNISRVLAIAGSGGHSLALDSNGRVWAWGQNREGQLGDGSTTDSSVPVQVSNLWGVIAIAGGGGHSLALDSNGKVWAWGDNWFGQLGDGSTTDSSVPVQVSNLWGVIAIAGGGGHSLALEPNGKVWAWGSNTFGELGNGNTTDSSVPILVSGLYCRTKYGAPAFATDRTTVTINLKAGETVVCYFTNVKTDPSSPAQSLELGVLQGVSLLEELPAWPPLDRSAAATTALEWPSP
jgi:hypothetical protein